MERLSVLGICGSLRQKSYNNMLLATCKKSPLFDIEQFDIGTLPLFNEDIEDIPPESVTVFRNMARTHQAILIVTPEYNWSISGVMKNAIDWLSTNKVNEIKSKTIAILGASNGQFGTVRAQLGLKPILAHLGAQVLNSPDIYIPVAQNVFNETGELADQTVQKRLEIFLRAFHNLILKENSH